MNLFRMFMRVKNEELWSCTVDDIATKALLLAQPLKRLQEVQNYYLCEVTREELPAPGIPRQQSYKGTHRVVRRNQERDSNPRWAIYPFLHRSTLLLHNVGPMVVCGDHQLLSSPNIFLLSSISPSLQ